MSQASESADKPPGPATTDREVKFRHSTDFVGLLSHLGVSILVSTYQAGKLVEVCAREKQLSLSFHNFEQPMGIAVSPRSIAVGTRGAVWFLASAPDIAPRLEPAGQHDACYLARSCHVTGEIHGHEMAWAGSELCVVNTLFSCLATLRPEFSFVPQWRPPFISELAAEDRCHLNGLAVADGRPKFVTALGETNTAAGWRPGKAAGGCLIDVASGAIVARGFCMPHSPRVHQGRTWLLDSGTGRLVVMQAGSDRYDTVAEFPGYARGMSMVGPYAFVGLSKIRETSTFGGIPIAERREELKCGVWVVDCRTGRTVVFLEFESGVDEIFDVQVLAGIRFPLLSGPHATVEGTPTIWIVPGMAERGQG